MNSSLLRYVVSTVSIGSSLLTFADTPTYSMDTMHPVEKTITPNASPVVQHGFDVFITADFIYWSGRLDHLEYAQTGVSATSAIVNGTGVTTSGNKISLDHKLSPAFKAGLGVNMGHDGWDSLVEYTWFRTTASQQETFPTTALALWSYAPSTIFSNESTVITSGSSNWRLHFNNIDWELGREFYISPHLLLRPHIGFKGSWQTQTYSVNQNSLTDTSESTEGSYVFNQTGSGSYSMEQKQTFWGLGVRAGLNTSWLLTCHWSLFGDCALTALWGQFDTSRTDHATFSSSNTRVPTAANLVVLNQSERFHTLRPVLEVDLGLRWDYWFLDDDYRIRIQAAWEEQVWFDQNQFLDFSTTRYGSLNLQGLTVAFRLDF